MIDLRKIFDLRTIFAVPKNFLKSKFTVAGKTQIIPREFAYFCFDHLIHSLGEPLSKWLQQAQARKHGTTRRSTLHRGTIYQFLSDGCTKVAIVNSPNGKLVRKHLCAQ